MLPACSICEVGFRNFVAVHELGVRKQMSGKVDLIIIVSLYGVKSDGIAEQADYDVCGSNHMMSKEELFGYFIKPGAHVGAFVFSLQIALS